MATMCRAIMAVRRIAFSRGLLLLLGVYLQSAIMNVPGNAQQTGGATTSLAPTTGLSSSSSSRAGTASQSSGGPTTIPKDFSELRIAPGDLLSVNVYDTPELSSLYRVDIAGDLTLPLCGKVNVRGLTISEAASRIEAVLKDRQIMAQPYVNLDVQQYAGQYVTITGEVTTPGRVALIAPTTLGEILAEAGGLTPMAGAHIKLRRGADDAQPEVDIPYSRNHGTREAASILVRPGDSIIVPRAGIVYVLGAVGKPGGYVMQEDGKLDVLQAVSLANGTTIAASAGTIYLLRRNPDGTEVDIALPLKKMQQGQRADVELHATDVLFVPTSKIKSILTNSEGILTAAASASIYAAVIH